MPTRISPTVKRRRLAAELRACRDRAGMTIEEVADRLEWSGGKISRIENARVSVLPRDVRLLLGVYGVPDGDPLRESLLILARESRQKGWWREFGDTVSQGFDTFETFVGLEAEAATLRIYEAEYVPGLLQTEDYARTILSTLMLTDDDEQITPQLAVRMARQARITGAGAPQIWVVLNEAVIRRIVGSSQIMRDQLARLIDASRQRNVTLQILPFSSGAHTGMDGAFWLLGFPEPSDPDVTYVHYYTGTVYLEKPEDIAAYTLIFDHLRAAALAPGPSRDLIARAHDELG